MGSCGLHVLHNSFRDGAGAINWNIEHALSSCWWLFKDSPARHDNFTQVTRSSIFPLKFCSQCWVENVQVAERVLENFPQMVAYVIAAKAGTIKEPRNKSYENVELVIEDTMFVAKLKFFLIIAKEIQPLLKYYQADRPLLPFFAQDIFTLIKGFMERFIKTDVMK